VRAVDELAKYTSSFLLLEIDMNILCIMMMRSYLMLGKHVENEK
jgi:hypothetical protein